MIHPRVPCSGNCAPARSRDISRCLHMGLALRTGLQHAARWQGSACQRRVVVRYQTGPSRDLCADGQCMDEEGGAVLVRDDLDTLLQALPADIRKPLQQHPDRSRLLEVVLDLGRRPEARFLGRPGGEYLRDAYVTRADLADAEAAVGAFGQDNRAGIPGTLHRISCIRNRQGAVVGLTCRVGRAVTGHTDMIRDLVDSGSSVLILGRPGVGKTTVIRELARVLADEMRKRVVIVDSSNEIGGDGDVPHPAIGSARRMQVPQTDCQHMVMIEAVENHMPQVVIVDEIGTEEEAAACRTIAERGVTLIGTAHGQFLENLIKNPTLSDLVGGVQAVTLGDEEAAKRGTQKTILERKAPPTFPILVEIRERSLYVAHWTQDSVDALLQGRQPAVQVRERDVTTGGLAVRETRYDLTLPAAGPAAGRSSYDDDFDLALSKDGLPAGTDRQTLHEGLELLRVVSARRHNSLSATKAPGGAAYSSAGGGKGGGSSTFSTTTASSRNSGKVRTKGRASR